MNASNFLKPQNTRRQAPVMPVWHQAIDKALFNIAFNDTIRGSSLR